MSSKPAPDTRVEPSVDDQFLDLICDDPDLLDAEFDAIIAAEWPEPPTAPPPLRSGQVRQRSRHPGVGGWARQRSPRPATTTTSNRQEGR
ncbi:MAG TPA: hypothetical protein VE441_16460 [Mycobacterium sp.]|jgi:hypothetical protein|nr:hypothetical protein [Mycobacterium sp.]